VRAATSEISSVVCVNSETAARTLREINSFTRDDGTPLNYSLVNTKDWCKNTFEVASQLRINTDYSYHRYDVLLLINGVPAVQIELKSLGISPRRAMQQVVTAGIIRNEEELSTRKVLDAAALTYVAAAVAAILELARLIYFFFLTQDN
jgi:type I site-specific restriction-modification system R (restriction) subunit